MDAVIDRLNDPAVAASMVTLLDNAELLSSLVLGLAGFMDRNDTVVDSVAESITDFNGATANGDAANGDALTEGAAGTGTEDTGIDGPLDVYRAFEDPDVQRGMGLLVEVARALGRRL